MPTRCLDLSRTAPRFAAAVLCSFVLLAAGPAAEAASPGIDAVKGKTYGLTKQHGPWMIMVASFTELPPEFRKAGMTPRQAADELVFELRSKGVPAYTFELGSTVEKVETVDRLNNPDTRVFASRRGSLCVLAGNYPAPDDKTAVATLKWMKGFRPKFLSAGRPDETGMVGLANGGTYQVGLDAKGQALAGPLGGAFLTVNPKLSIDEVRSRQVDRELLVLNASEENSLLENKGEYTLIVASFYGSSVTQVPGTSLADISKVKGFDSLEQATQDAYELAYVMRKEMKLDAYVWHDRHKSVVTVGTFETADDPRIPQVISTYGAKRRINPANGQEIATAEMVTVPRDPTPQNPVRKKWIFDPQPTLMPVPKFGQK